MNYELIACDVSEKILTITLNRPEKLNACSRQMIDELIHALRLANTNDEIGAVIVTGAGRAFCAGHDLSSGTGAFDMTSRFKRDDGKPGLPDDFSWGDERVRDSGGRLTLEIFECLKPVIAAVNGPAVGIGATMTLPMDIRIASDQARFGFVFARRGLVPEAASSWFLPHIVGIEQALAWCYSGKVFDAQEALRGRLISEVVSHNELLPRARETAKEIISNCAPVSVALIRQMMWRMLGADHPMEAHKIDSRGIFARGPSDDVKEGVQSFVERRPPHFPQKVSKDMPGYFPWWQPRKYS
jgi:enoyl-CoA hydratase/carnithine racemase